jgi:carboxypeptidase C (cathepsin A)
MGFDALEGEEDGWRAWTLDGQERMGGYVTRYKGGFDYVTIRGSGHMVPEFKPAAAAEMLKQFLGKGEYQKYTTKPEHGEL